LLTYAALKIQDQTAKANKMTTPASILTVASSLRRKAYEIEEVVIDDSENEEVCHVLVMYAHMQLNSNTVAVVDTIPVCQEDIATLEGENWLNDIVCECV
jgi:hypothetical protein